MDTHSDTARAPCALALAAFAAIAGALALSSCANIEGKPMAFEQHPIAVRVDRKFVDEDSPLENRVVFRNTGTQVLTFDYTIADQPGVPHVDQDGPNSGLVENLYPGAEIVVPNPSNLKNVYATLGNVVYGKKTPEEVVRIYGGSKALTATL